MSDFNWCHGPHCHEKHTVDRGRGVKGSKVLRTRKVKTTNLCLYIDIVALAVVVLQSLFFSL